MRPRLGIAVLLRGAPPASVAAWVTYHLAVGFHSLYIYFDEPDDPAVSAARAAGAAHATALSTADSTADCAAGVAAEGGGVVVTLCDSAFWEVQRRTNLFFTSPVVDVEAGGLSVSSFERGDVQSRQCVVVQQAVSAATSSGLDWLLHMDIDELWYVPTAAGRADAPIVFSAVPADVGELKLYNHEVVQRMAPAECWFTQATLFKVHGAFTRSVAANRAMEMRADARITMEDARFEAARRAGSLLRKTDPESSSDDDEGGAEDDADDFLRCLGRVQRERARRLRTDIGEHPSHELRRRWRELRDTGRADAAKAARKVAKTVGTAEASAYTYFTAHAQGKSAVRLRLRPGGMPCARPPRAGVHNWDHVSGRTHSCLGTGAPVILHYANPNYAYWVRKYEMLTTAPAFGEGAQISLRTLPELKAHLEVLLRSPRKCEPMAREGVCDDPTKVLGDSSAKLATTKGMHEMAAAIVGGGDVDLARGLYRHLFCCTDVLPELASHGLLVEITFVRELLLRLSAERRSSLPSFDS